MYEMNQKFCQCCGMPMGDTNELYGTNADGSKNEEYCKYCFENGKGAGKKEGNSSPTVKRWRN